MIKREVIANGATTEEAIENGCRELGMEREEVQFEIIEMPKSKTFGLFGGSPAVVRVYIETEGDEEAEDIEETEQSCDSDESTFYDESENGDNTDSSVRLREPGEGDEIGQKAADYLDSIIKAMGLNAINIEVKYNEDGSGCVLDLTGDGLGTIIGRRGETLNALQYLVSLAANNVGEEYYRVAINIGNYREKREDSLENLAKKTAGRSLKINKNLALDPMNPYERRIVHTAVQEIEGATSWSVGDGAKRHVVIGPVGMDEGSDGLPVNHSRSGQRGTGRGGYGNNRGGYGGGRQGGYNNRGGYGGGRQGGYNNRGGYGGGRQGGYGSRDGYNRGNGGGRYNSSRDYGESSGYSRRSYDQDGQQDGYRRSYNDRPYNNGGYKRSYDRNNQSQYNNRYNEHSQQPTQPREAKKDVAAPLYGRIEIPKKKTDEE